MTEHVAGQRDDSTDRTPSPTASVVNLYNVFRGVYRT